MWRGRSRSREVAGEVDAVVVLVVEVVVVVVVVAVVVVVEMVAVHGSRCRVAQRQQE